MFNTLNNWVIFLSSLGFTLGFIWGGIRLVQKLIASAERKKIATKYKQDEHIALRKDVNRLFDEIGLLRKEVTPNGKNTQRLGDISARTEQKVDNLIGFLERYAAKVDKMGEKIERHLGWHEGNAE